MHLDYTSENLLGKFLYTDAGVPEILKLLPHNKNSCTKVAGSSSISVPPLVFSPLSL